MTDVFVAKFGGSSVANAEQIRKVADIVASDPRRRFVVVSAPGRSRPDEEKTTDHLFNIATQGVHFSEQRKRIDAETSRKAVLERFGTIAGDLGVDGAPLLEALEKDLATDLKGGPRIAFLASRGEHYNARLIAEYLKSQDMDARACLPEDFGLLVSSEYRDAKVIDEAYPNMAARLNGDAVSVIPGFYGITQGGEIARPDADEGQRPLAVPVRR